MRTLSAMFAAALMLAAAAPGAAVAQGAPPRPDDQQAQTQHGQAQHQPAPPPPAGQQPHRPAPDYGRWDNRWGPRPPAPPRHWARAGDWHRHVRACQLRYRSYSARTDSYIATNGRRLRCRL